MARNGPFQIQALEGSPITIGETTLIPQAQFISMGHRQGEVTKRGWGGWGWAWGLLIPRAVIEQRGDRERRIPIPDHTAQVLLVQAAIGLAVALLSILVHILVQSFSAEGKGG
jgi:hypothetical protein